MNEAIKVPVGSFDIIKALNNQCLKAFLVPTGALEGRMLSGGMILCSEWL